MDVLLHTSEADPHEYLLVLVTRSLRNVLIGDVSFGGRSRFRSDRAIKKGRRLRSQAALVPAVRSGLVTGGAEAEV